MIAINNYNLNSSYTAKAYNKCKLNHKNNIFFTGNNDISKRRKLPIDIYFIKMKSYDKNIDWAYQIVNLTYKIYNYSY